MSESPPLVVLSAHQIEAIERELNGVREQLAGLMTARDE